MSTSPELLRALPQFRRMAFQNLAQLAQALRELANLAEACADPALSTEDVFRRPEAKELEVEFEPQAVGAVEELIEAVDARWDLLDAATDEVSTLFRATAQSLDVLKQVLSEGLPAEALQAEGGCDCGDDCDCEDGCDCDCDDDDCAGHHHH
ncbi:MAG: hypothetical protein ACM3RP_00815 [Chitinophagales bacterium]